MSRPMTPTIAPGSRAASSVSVNVVNARFDGSEKRRRCTDLTAVLPVL